MSKTLILEFNLSKETDTCRGYNIPNIKQLAEDGGLYYARWVSLKGIEWAATSWEPVSATEADAITRDYNAALRRDAPNVAEHTDGKKTNMGINHLEMAIETLRNMSDGDGPEDHLFAIGLGLAALTERADLLLELTKRAAVSLEKIADKLPPRRRTPTERKADLNALGYTFVDIETGQAIAPPE